MAVSLGHVLAQLHHGTPPHLAELPDAVLLEHFVQRHEEPAFTALVARHSIMVLHVCQRIVGHVQEAEDAFQATFLILARKAPTLKQPDALAGWLHGVARRVALRARCKAATRIGQTLHPDELLDGRFDPLAQLTARELLTVLDEEVARLPLAQRSAIALCCLQGRTQEEAARLLGWTAGSLKGHLERGRRRLQNRLRRRGIALSAALAVVAMSRGEAAPARLLRCTFTTSLGGGNGSSAAELANSVLRSMFVTKFTAVMTAMLAVVLAASGTIALIFRSAPAEAPQDKTLTVPVASKNGEASKPPVRKDFWGDPLPPHAVARLGSHRLYHGAVDLRQVTLSPDGKLVASTDDKGFNKLWDVRTGRELPVAENLRLAFLFAAKGKLLGADLGNRLWDLTTGKEVPAAGIDINAARKRKDSSQREALSPDGKIIAAWDDKGIRLLDAHTRKELPPLQDQPKESVFPPCFSPDGKLLAVPGFLPSSRLPGVRLWDLATRKEVRWLRGKDFQIFDVAFSGDGKLVAAADGAGVTLWEAATGKWLHDPGHTYCVESLAFSPDGKTLVTGAFYNDRFLRAWDLYTGRPRRKWEGHNLGIIVVLVAPDGKHVISTSQDGTIRLWDLASGKERSKFADKIIAWSAALSPDGKMLATGSQGIQLWDFASRRKVRSFAAGTVLNLAFSPDGTKLASTASKDTMVRLWNAADGKELRSFKGETEGGTKFAFAPDGRALATGDRDGIVHLWDLTTGTELRRLGRPLKPGPRCGYVLGGLIFSPDGRVVAVGYSDQTVRLLEVATGKERARYQGHKNGLMTLAFSPDGRLLASGGWDRTVMVWDITGRICPDHPDPVRLDAKAQERLWAELADSDAAKAYQAMQILLGAEQTVSLLQKHLRPVVAADPARLKRLVAELDSDDFAVREGATKELVAAGDRAEPLLREAAPKASAEARRRIQGILAQIAPATSADRIRDLRSVEVLEWLGTLEARQLLKTLAGGDAETRLTREAKAALERLAKRGGT